MIVVHHLNNSHSHVILWLMEELDLPYEIVEHRRDPVTRRSPHSLKLIHPAAKAPTIEDHGIPMIESTGIMLYILEAYGEGRLRPPRQTPQAMQFFQWLTYIEGSAKGPLMQMFRVLNADLADPMRQLIQQAAALPLGLIESALENEETIVPGMFTAADIQLTFLEELMEGVGELEKWPNMKAHMERMRGREAYKRAAGKGGPVGFKELFATRQA